MLTKAKYNKGFSSNTSILSRLNLSVGGHESSPQSLTLFSLKPLAVILKDRQEL
jgi:hypothetical protein